METWRILVFIAILAVLFIGAWYAIKLKGEELREQLYVREKKDFFDKFVKLIDWKDGNKSGQC